MIIQKSLKFLSAITGASVFVILGIYLLNAYQTRISQLIGYANIIFFSGLIIWALYRVVTRKESNKT